MTRIKNPTAVAIYGVKNIESYPCGCKFWVLDDGTYEHFVNPNCGFDKDKVGKGAGTGYVYKPEYRE